MSTLPPSSLPVTILMGAVVGALLQVPRHHSYLRSAGMVGQNIYEELVAAGRIFVRGVHGGMWVEMGSGKEEEGAIGADTNTHEGCVNGGGDGGTTISHYPLSLTRIVVPCDAVVEICIEFLEQMEDNDYDPVCVVYTDERLHGTSPSSTSSPPRSCPHVRVSSSTSLQHYRYSQPTIPDHMTIYSAKEYSGTWDDITIEFDEGFELLTGIGKGLLGGSFVRSIDLTHFCNVTTIGARFLVNCARLTDIDLSPLSKVTKVGSGFLERCTALVGLDLAPLAALTTIPPQFLHGCSSLKVVNMGCLILVKSIGDNLLRSAGAQLISVTLPPNVEMRNIGNHCLDGCPNIPVDGRVPPPPVGANALWSYGV